jgi:hypothetical protein
MQKRYTPVTAEQMASFRTQATAKGITVPDGNEGIVTITVALWFTLKIAFIWDGTNLDMHILGEPPFITPEKVWSTLDPYFVAPAA